jgi:hypothetical protein
VFVAEVGGAVHLLSADQVPDLGLLALTAEVGAVRRLGVVVAWSKFHIEMVNGGAGGSLSIHWMVE